MKAKLTLLSILVCIFFASSQSIHYEFFDTIRYQDGPFISPNTVLKDIGDDGTMVGYFENENGFNNGLLVHPDGTYSTFELSPYSNTELTGINNAGFVIGKAYNSVVAAEIFQASIINGVVDQAVILTWDNVTGTNKDVGKLNDDDVAVGTARISTQNWLHYESIQAPFTIAGSERYSITNPTFTTYNTYGLGLNNVEKYTGWYLDGVSRIPYVFDGISDAFFPQSHVLPSAPAPRTFLNDINDNNLMAVSYRLASGILQSTIGTYNGNSTSYDALFPLVSFTNFELLGINDNNDVVGYYENANNEKVGIYLLVDGPTLDNFNIAEDALLFSNDSATFELLPGTYDYRTEDPYLGIQDSFYAKYLQDINFVMSVDQLNSIYSGQRSGSWPAFVKSRAEERSYVVQTNGTKIPREEALIKWIEKSFNNFEGYCYGMSLFALQNLSDPSLLQNRFGTAYTPSANAVNYDANNLDFNEMISTLHLQQIGEKFDSVHKVQSWLRSAYDDQNYSVVMEFMEPQMEKVIEGLRKGNPDSSYMLAFKAVYPHSFYHAVMPFKVTRDITFGIPGDTLHCIDPNYPGNILKIYIDYNNGQHRGYVGSTLVYQIAFAYHSSYLKNILPEAPVNYFEAVSGDQPKSLSPDLSYLGTGSLCDFTIENVNNPAQTVSMQGGIYNSTWDGISSYTRMDGGDQVDNIMGTGVLNIETTISNCLDRNYFTYAFEDGMMVYERQNVLMGETDLVKNNGPLQSISNTDASDKTFNMIVIHSGNNTETMVAINEYTLAQNEAVDLETLDNTHFFLSNDEQDDKTYNLVVNYVDASFHIQSSFENIPINNTTNHTIVVQPAMQGQEVIILVDEGQNGNYEDTLFNIGGTTSILDLNSVVSFNVFPIPSKDYLNIHLKCNEKEIGYVELVSELGEIVLNEKLDFVKQENFKLDVTKINRGFYFLRVLNAQGHVIARNKVLFN